VRKQDPGRAQQPVSELVSPVSRGPQTRATTGPRGAATLLESARRPVAVPIPTMDSLMRSVPKFYGKRQPRQDPQEHVDLIDLLLEDKEINDAAKLHKYQITLLRTSLEDKPRGQSTGMVGWAQCAATQGRLGLYH
jgi:hypothetical protein